MKITIGKLILIAGVFAATLCLDASPSQAYQVGDDKWCAVTDNSGDVMLWDCEYDTAADCAPAVVTGTRGFCALNPSYQPPAPNTQR